MKTHFPGSVLFSLFLVSTVCAQDVQQHAAQVPHETFEVRTSMMVPHPSAGAVAEGSARHDTEPVRLNVSSLSSYPQLLFNVLMQAVTSGNDKVVAQLLPHYRRQARTDTRLLQWGEAVLASSERNYEEAVRRYREIISREPQNLPARLQMATALFLNFENEAALDQFKRIRAMPLSAPTKQAIDKYMDAIHKRSQWNVSGGLSYIRDDNVNNAPRSGTTLYGFRAWQPETASGLQYRFLVERRIPLQSGRYTRFRLETGGKHYTSNRKYSELTSSLGLAMGWQTGRYDFSLGPVYEKKWYAGGRADSESLKQYSRTMGLALEASYWLRPQWQWNTLLQWARERFDRYRYLDGNTLLWSNTLFYISSVSRYWNVGIDFYQKGARDPSHAFTLTNLRAGWNQDWPWGISTSVQISYGQRKYKGYRLFLAEKQKNYERGASLSVWHRGLHLWGFTPRVTYQYQSVRSNHAFYEFAKPRIFVELSRRF